MLSAFLAPVLNSIFGVIDKVVPDADAATRIKADLQTLAMTGQMKEIEAAAAVIVAEAQGDSWLQRNWRPLLMVLFGVIIANNYIVAPIAGGPMMPLPAEMWDLLKLGIGGYIVGRSGEKVAKVWKGKSNG